MIALSPSLHNLAESLFCNAEKFDIPVEKFAPDSESTDDEGWREIVVPDWVQTAIASHVAARAIVQPNDLRVGDIIMLDRIGNDDKHDGRQPNITVGVLLIEKRAAGIWHGLMVAGEKDYASQFDVFIDEKDEPVDPAMRFIQVWNPVELVFNTECRRLGVLSAARLATIAEVSEEALAGIAQTALPTAITRIGLRQLASGASVVTGTSLGNLNDPRRHYQSLYRALAREASVPAIVLSESQARANSATSSKPSWKSWLWPTLAGIAATILVGQNVLLRTQIDTESLEKTRSVKGAETRRERVGPKLKVLFKPNVSYEAIAKAVRDIGAQIVSGPDDNGDIYLSVSPNRIQEAATVLRIRDLVDSVEIIPEQKEIAQ